MKTAILTSLKYIGLFCLLVANSGLVAQESYKLGGEPELKVSGTSSVNNWDMISRNAVGEGTFKVENGTITEMKDVKIVMRARSLKSGKVGPMDSNTYKALKVEKYPTISFQLDKLVSQSTGSMVAYGFLNVAGVRRAVTFDCEYNLNQNKINLRGSTAFKLTDYQINPPTAVFGTIKTGNEVEISFNVLFIS